MSGSVTGIFISEERSQTLVRVEECLAIAGVGLEGDRYAAGAGTFSNLPGQGRHLTLIDRDAASGAGVPDGLSRRNLETTGVSLNDLIGHFFTLGEVLAFGVRRCDPCTYLENLQAIDGLEASLADKGGLRADILLGGTINEGCSITDLGSELSVFLDDERVTPEGWYRVYWPDEAVALLQTGKVSRLSLDHDLGDDARGTGYDVLLWIEEQVFGRCFAPPALTVHSANVSARAKMEAGIEAIRREHGGKRNDV